MLSNFSFQAVRFGEKHKLRNATTLKVTGTRYRSKLYGTSLLRKLARKQFLKLCSNVSTRDELGITGTKCANAAQGESKIVVSVLVTFRSLFKHVC